MAPLQKLTKCNSKNYTKSHKYRTHFKLERKMNKPKNMNKMYCSVEINKQIRLIPIRALYGFHFPVEMHLDGHGLFIADFGMRF